MSVEAIALVLHHSKAKGTALLVLLGIANHEGDGGAFPAVETLAKYARVDRRAVQRSLRQLEGSGEIRTHLGRGGDVLTRGGRQRPNLYEVCIACPADCDRSTHHRTGGGRDDAPRENGRGAVSETKGAVPEPPQGAVAQPPESSTQSPKESSAREPFAEDFERAWKAYPRKIEKQKAKRAYIARRRAGVSAADLQQATLNYANERKGEDPTFTKHAATFYGPDEPWRDHLKGSSRTSGSRSPADMARQAEQARGY